MIFSFLQSFSSAGVCGIANTDFFKDSISFSVRPPLVTAKLHSD